MGQRADATGVKDRYLVGSIAAGFISLTAGALGNAFGLEQLGIVAGLSGFAAAIFAAAVGARIQKTDRELAERTKERDENQRELDSLTAMISGESASDSRLALAPSGDLEPAMDTASGLLDQKFFTVLVQQRVAAARRHLQPIAIVIFDIDGLDRADDLACDAAIGTLGETMIRTLRESDAACRVGNTMAAAILEDTAEAGAVWAAERIRGTLNQTNRGDLITVSAGIACYPTHALGATELIDRAGCALEAARSQGRDRLEIASSD